MTYLAICPWNGQALPVHLAPKHRALWFQGGPVGDGVEVVVRWSGGIHEALRARDRARELREWGYRKVALDPASVTLAVTGGADA